MRALSLAIVALLLVCNVQSQQYKVASPDGRLVLSVSVGKDLRYSVALNGQEVILPSVLSLTIDGNELGKNPLVAKTRTSRVNEMINAGIGRKSKWIPNVYTGLRIDCKKDYAIQFRVFNNGVAYRFVTAFKKEILVNRENLEINFPDHTRALFPEEESLLSDNERPYLDNELSAFAMNRFCSLPMLATVKNNVRVLITDADLLDYPNMFLSATGTNTLKAKFPPVILSVVPAQRGADRMEKIMQEADHIAATTGTRNFPWRVFTITDNDCRLAESDLVYQLSTPNVLKDVSWIRPGKVSWDWWNFNNIYGVDFHAGINTDTYKYYIDFASKYGLEYIIMDEGWSASTTNLDAAVPSIDLPGLIRYGKEKNVGIILWALWKPLDKNMDVLLDQYAAWGIKGIKVDFMQRSDQWMVNYYERLARACAERHLLVDFHGAYKPAGLHRKYPNVMSHEGVKGLEQDKWTHSITPEHDLTLPFTRMVAGPMDYTPGAMNNANRQSFRDVFENPMSMGTRCHQLAMYIVYESQLMMLADSPTKYYKENESTSFIAQIPVTWDETKVLSARVGDYILTTRRKGDTWYAGAMTDWDARELTMDCSFLPPGKYEATIMQDGMNAARNGNDYKKLIMDITPSSKLTLPLAPGGGWAAIIKRK